MPREPAGYIIAAMRRMRQVGHDQCMHPAADDHVVIQLSRDEALVLYELLHRWEEHAKSLSQNITPSGWPCGICPPRSNVSLQSYSILPTVASSQTRECDWRIDQSRRHERTESGRSG
jgi:hypothetical protein